ncbi:hypothetical protein [Streptomyces sp. NBC_00385]|uniref:hypothetical protein n=1 Tax=Streptomyces sp. NBC_00385 TaxID=2975733 RepID=UPI002DDA6A9F|nr:hypothetical protein [Streptomyces sp. NBC_00385]WRZ05056.1 hypothetical protein OG959_17710 [Streptomyces sp. NBC_00385]
MTRTTAAGGNTPGRRAPAPQLEVVAALFVDFGVDRGPEEEQRPPRARYECVPCNYRSHVVTGAAAVAAFVETAADAHRAVCPSRQETHL